MKRRIGIYKMLLTVWLLWGCFASSLCASPQINQPSAWRTTPVMSNDRMPSCQFRSTSSFAPAMGSSAYSSTVYSPGASSPAYAGRRKAEGDPPTNPWDEDVDPSTGDPNDQGIGNLYTPVGDVPFVLMAVMIGLYVIWKKNRKKTPKNLRIS